MSHRVLLCDDEIHILKAAEIKLKRAGFDVVCAADGQEAWEEIERQCPDLLVTDCQMPRLDGFGLVDKVRACHSTSHLPILMLTAKGFEFQHQDVARRWGIKAILAKPFSPRQLLKHVEDVLAGNEIEHPVMQI
ncbi:MAG: response regulator [Planctomycetales bacterium]|nr:response regulator [Planctomycetales bacterium]